VDILAHALWVGVGAVWLRRKRRIGTRAAWAAVAIARETFGTAYSSGGPAFGGPR